MSDEGLILTPAELEARLQGFVREHLKDHSPETVGTYRRSLRAFESYFTGCDEPFRFRAEDVEAYKKYLVEERDLSQVSISTYLTALRRFCDYLCRIGLLETNPATAVRGSRRPSKHTRRTLDAADVERLFMASRDDSAIARRDRAMAHCMVYAGLSEIEIVRTDVQDLEQTLLGWVLRVQGKGRKSKDERVPVDERAVEAIQSYLAVRGRLRPEDPLFVSHGHRSDGQRLNTRSVRSRINRMLRAAGLKREGISPHSLTHTAPLLWLDAGIPIEEVRRRMRHGTIETTRLYIRKETDQVDDEPVEEPPQ